MLPGKQYKPEDFLRIAWRRKWLVLVPFVVIGTGTIVVARFLPDVYQAEALILVVPQRVPESYVRSTVTVEVQDRIQMISQQILSRARLERIIQEFDLYPNERKTGIMQDVVEKMRLDIAVNVAKPKNKRDDGGSSFRVGYSSRDPRKAMQVTERLASLFIEENLRDREILAEGTDQFLESQLQEARQRLLENEKQLEQYRRRFAGQLPTQLQSNLQVLQNAQTQLQALAEATNRDRDRLVAVERMIGDIETLDSVPVAQAARVPSNRDQNKQPVKSAAEELEAAQAMLRGLELRLKPEHPDIVRMKRAIQELERKAEAEALQTPLSPTAAPVRTLTAEEQARRRRLIELQAEKLQLESRIAQKGVEDTRLRNIMTTYQTRIEAAPTRESELVALTRDYDTLKQRYQALLSKAEDAKISANLERRQIGEQFKLIDPPRVPDRPISPNRGQINLFGALAGLAVGLGLAALLEYRDSAMRTDEDVTVSLALPVLAMIPVMTTPLERRRARRRRLFSLAAAGSLAVTVTVLIWKFGRGIAF